MTLIDVTFVLSEDDNVATLSKTVRLLGMPIYRYDAIETHVNGRHRSVGYRQFDDLSQWVDED